jgi:diguanylate cyclase (GGDEF)-like protein/PAS domain S-box-containing protein
MDEVIDDEYQALIQFLYMAPIGLMQTRVDGEILMVNPLCAQWLMPLSRDGDLSNLFTALERLAPDLRTQVHAFADPQGMICQGALLHLPADPNGHSGSRTLSLSLMKLDAQRLMAVLSDVTESERRERELRQSQAWMNNVVTGLTDYALMTVNAQGEVRDWNPSVQRVLGFGRRDTLGRSFALFYPPDLRDDSAMAERLEEAERSGWSLDEGWRQRADGSRFWGSCLVAPLHMANSDTEERAYSLVVRDITDRRESTEALRRAVTCDHLTGLANRRALFEACELELMRWRHTPKPLSLVLVDADHFKRINDSFGHAVGDQVLRHLAGCLSDTFRVRDVVARLGGEEFVALLPGCDEAMALRISQRLCDAVAAQALTVDGTTVRCTVSVGVATMDEHIDGVDALIQRADVAMYAAKAAGRNRVCAWHPAIKPAAKTLADV